MRGLLIVDNYMGDMPSEKSRREGIAFVENAIKRAWDERQGGIDARLLAAEMARSRGTATKTFADYVRTLIVAGVIEERYDQGKRVLVHHTAVAALV